MQALMCMLRLGGATKPIHDLLKVIIASEMEAGHVTAWSMVDSTNIETVRCSAKRTTGRKGTGSCSHRRRNLVVDEKGGAG